MATPIPLSAADAIMTLNDGGGADDWSDRVYKCQPPKPDRKAVNYPAPFDDDVENELGGRFVMEAMFGLIPDAAGILEWNGWVKNRTEITAIYQRTAGSPSTELHNYTFTFTPRVAIVESGDPDEVTQAELTVRCKTLSIDQGGTPFTVP